MKAGSIGGVLSYLQGDRERDNLSVEFGQLYFLSSFFLMTGEYRFRLQGGGRDLLIRVRWWGLPMRTVAVILVSPLRSR